MWSAARVRHERGSDRECASRDRADVDADRTDARVMVFRLAPPYRHHVALDHSDGHGFHSRLQLAHLGLGVPAHTIGGVLIRAVIRCARRLDLGRTVDPRAVHARADVRAGAPAPHARAAGGCRG